MTTWASQHTVAVAAMARAGASTPLEMNLDTVGTELCNMKASPSSRKMAWEASEHPMECAS